MGAELRSAQKRRSTRPIRAQKLLRDDVLVFALIKALHSGVELAHEFGRGLSQASVQLGRAFN